MCEWFDETIGDLLAKLEKNGQAKDTLVIYLHDNGWIQDPDSPNYAPQVETVAHTTAECARRSSSGGRGT